MLRIDASLGKSARARLGLGAICVLTMLACSDSTAPNAAIVVLPVELTTMSVGIEPPAGILAQAEADSVTVFITQRNVCGVELGASAAITDRTLSLSLTFSAPTVPVPCAAIAGSTTFRVTARDVPSGPYNLVADERFTQGGRLTSDSVLLRQPIVVR